MGLFSWVASVFGFGLQMSQLHDKIGQQKVEIKLLEKEVDKLNTELRFARPPMKAVVEKEIDHLEMRKILEKATEQDHPHKCNIHLWDYRFRLTTRKEVERFLKWHPLENEEYEHPFHDCDDFAVRLWGASKHWTRGLAFGILIAEGHALNFFVDSDLKVWAVEPQADGIFPIRSMYEDHGKIYIMMIL